MLTIDEAIKHCNDKAEELRCDFHTKTNRSDRNDCLECAKEHEQLAEWLTELKELRKEKPCGTWTRVQNMRWVIWRCSNCNQLADNWTTYCPWCGADMRGNNNE